MFLRNYNLYRTLPRKPCAELIFSLRSDTSRNAASKVRQLSPSITRNLSSQANAPQNLLDYLRTRSSVDCDTLDASATFGLGPFVDCTSNPAIAYNELSKRENEPTLREAAKMTSLGPNKPGDNILFPTRAATLGTEIATILLASRMSSHVSSTIHLPVNPFYSYSKYHLIEGAKRLVRLASWISPHLQGERICITVPSTWAGFEACKFLEQNSIKTLATTLFSMEQVELAGEAKCTYITPYVNDLRVHFDPSYTDPSPIFELCRSAQSYYRNHNFPTRVLPASLTSVSDCMAVAGADHITVSPALLHQLASTPLHLNEDGRPVGYESVYDIPRRDREVKIRKGRTRLDLHMQSQAAWQMRFTRREDGKPAKKLVDAINILCDMQLKLEALMERYVDPNWRIPNKRTGGMPSKSEKSGSGKSKKKKRKSKKAKGSMSEQTVDKLVWRQQNDASEQLVRRVESWGPNPLENGNFMKAYAMLQERDTL